MRSVTPSTNRFYHIPYEDLALERVGDCPAVVETLCYAGKRVLIAKLIDRSHDGTLGVSEFVVPGLIKSRLRSRGPGSEVPTTDVEPLDEQQKKDIERLLVSKYGRTVINFW